MSRREPVKELVMEGLVFPPLLPCPLATSSTLLLPPSLAPSLLPFPSEGFLLQEERWAEEGGRDGGREGGRYVTVERSKGQEGLRRGVLRTWLKNQHPNETMRATVRERGG
jgi:hypothetical protein